jgi:hypothetical protein
VTGARVTAAVLEAQLAEMPAAEIDELAHLLHERATRERRELTTDEAWEAISRVCLSSGWEKSILPDIGRLVGAAKQLSLDGWRPEQIATALVTAGLEVERDGRIVAYAISRGIADARRLLR